MTKTENINDLLFQKAAAYDKYQTQVEEQIDKDNKAKLAAEEKERMDKEIQLHKVIN